MRNRLIWTAQARSDLVDIYTAIGSDNLAAADRYLDRLLAAAEGLSEHPRLGTRRPDIAPGVRILVEHPYLLIYRVEPDNPEHAVAFVELVRVVDGRRDLKSFL